MKLIQLLLLAGLMTALVACGGPAETDVETDGGGDTEQMDAEPMEDEEMEDEEMEETDGTE